MARASHLLKLYELLHNSRQRAAREDWARRLRQLMHWPHRDHISRVGGTGKQRMLILREKSGINSARFSHVFLSELLRAAIVASVSGNGPLLSRCHIRSCMKAAFAKGIANTNRFETLSIPTIVTAKALKQLRSDPNARPGNLVKQAIQEQLHRDFTFHNKENIVKATEMLGIDRFFDKVAAQLGGPSTATDVIDTLEAIGRRRNQIVHDADLVRKARNRNITLRDIKYNETNNRVL